MKHFRLIQFLLVFCISFCATAEEIPVYERYANEIIFSFEREAINKFKFLRPGGSGGSMPHDIEEISVGFNTMKKMNLEEARKLQVVLTTLLQQKINSHEKIRPFLREFPFTYERIEISISSYDKSGEWPLDESIVLAHTAKGKIFYNIATMGPSKTIPFTDMRTGITTNRTYPPSVILETYKEESFEEALKIVEGKKGEKHESI